MPCRGEIPFVRRAYDRYHRKGFDVLYVSIDSDAGNWKQALGEEKMPWPQLLDTGRTSFTTYETSAVPTIYPRPTAKAAICRLNARRRMAGRRAGGNLRKMINRNRNMKKILLFVLGAALCACTSKIPTTSW